MLAPCNICFLKTINYIEVQKYLLVINGLRRSIAYSVVWPTDNLRLKFEQRERKEVFTKSHAQLSHIERKSKLSADIYLSTPGCNIEAMSGRQQGMSLCLSWLGTSTQKQLSF